MFNHQTLESRLNEAVTLLQSVIPEQQMGIVREFIDVREWGLALETLCDVLYENDYPVPARAYELIDESGRMMQLDEGKWQVLQSQVSVAA